LTYWSKFFFNCSYAGISFVLSMWWSLGAR
jgi:hypothetical protein